MPERPRPKWTRLYCLGAEMAMSTVQMGGLVCRDRAGHVFHAMLTGLTSGTSVGLGEALVLWIRGEGKIAGVYAGGSIALTGVVGPFGGRVGYFGRLGQGKSNWIILTGASATLPTGSSMDLCAVPLSTGLAAKLAAGLAFDGGSLAIMSAD